MKVEELNNKVIEIIRESLNLPDDYRVTPDTKLQEDIGINSLAILVTVSKLEEEFNIRIPFRSLSKIVTIKDLQEYILQKLL